MSTSGDMYAVKRGTTGATSAPNTPGHAPVTVSTLAAAANGSAS
jgi:hypothetical protein